MWGTVTGSIAIAADGVNNLSDASSNIVSLIGFKLSSRKPDQEHPYGHGRYEYLAGLVVCLIIIGHRYSAWLGEYTEGDPSGRGIL